MFHVLSDVRTRGQIVKRLSLAWKLAFSTSLILRSPNPPPSALAHRESEIPLPQ